MRPLLRVIAVCSAALFVPLLIPLATGRVFTLDDLGRYHIPMRAVYSEALHQGDSILWTPAVFSGFFLFGESQLGMAHPWHLLLYRFLPLVAAFNLELIGSYVVMFTGVVLLLKRIGFSRESRWFGAMVFTFSGYNLFHVIHLNLIAGVAHIPWLLLAAHVLATQRTARHEHGRPSPSACFLPRRSSSAIFKKPGWDWSLSAACAFTCSGETPQHAGSFLSLGH